MKQGDNELGEIRYMCIKRDSKGAEEIEVQGRFLSGWLGKRLVLEQVITTDTTPAILQRLVGENVINPTDPKRVIPDLYLTDVSAVTRDQISYTSEYMATVLAACEAAAKASKLGFRIATDIRQKKHYFEVYDGKDLTANNGIRRQSNFAPEFNNVLGQEYTNSIENLRTTAYAGGEETEDAPRRVVEVGEPAEGLERHEVFVDASDIPQTYMDNLGIEVTIPDSDYDEMLMQRGESELSNYTETMSFVSKIDPHSGLIYKQDYDIGDRVTCLNRNWGVRIDARITEIAETYQTKDQSLDITFGVSLPTLLETIKQIRR